MNISNQHRKEEAGVDTGFPVGGERQPSGGRRHTILPKKYSGTLLAFIAKIIFHNVKVCSDFMLQMVTLVSF